jgi:hypothetical protein
VIESLNHFLVDVLLYQLHIDQIPCHRIHFTLYPNLQIVIVAMVMGVVAESKELLVLLITPTRHMQTMGGIEMGGSVNGYAVRHIFI